MQAVQLHLGVAAVLRDHVELGKDQAAQSLGLLVLGKLHVQGLRHVVQLRRAGNAPAVVAQGDDLLILLGIELVVDVAHNLLQQILHSHEAGGAAVLVHHNGQVDLPALHVAEELIGAHRLGHEIGRAQQLPHRAGGGFAGVEQPIAGVQDADDVVGVLLIHRETGQAGGLDGLRDLLRRVVHPQHHHVGAVDHHVPGGHVVKFEDVLDHLLLTGLDGAFLLADVHHHADALLRYLIVLLVGVDMYQTQHGICGDSQQPDERPHDGGQERHHPAGEAGHLLALLHGHPLGYQLAEDQREEGEDNGDQDNGQGVHRGLGGGGQGILGGEPLGQAAGQVVGGEGGAQKARQGDADLDGGEKPGGLLHDVQETGSLFVALLGLVADHRLIEGDDRDFRGGKVCVDCDEYDLE